MVFSETSSKPIQRIPPPPNRLHHRIPRHRTPKAKYSENTLNKGGKGQMSTEIEETKSKSQAPGLLGLLGSPVSSWVNFGKQQLEEPRSELAREDYLCSTAVATSGSASSTDEEGREDSPNSGVEWNMKHASEWSWSERPVASNNISSLDIIPPPSENQGIEVGLSGNVGNRFYEDCYDRNLPPLSQQQRSLSGSSSESDKNDRPRATRTVNRPITRPRHSKNKPSQAADDSSSEENVRSRHRSYSTNARRSRRSKSRTHTSRRTRSKSRTRTPPKPNANTSRSSSRTRAQPVANTSRRRTRSKSRTRTPPKPNSNTSRSSSRTRAQPVANTSRSSSRTRAQPVANTRRSRSKSRTRTTTGLRARSLSKVRNPPVSLHERGRASHRSVIPTRRSSSSPPISPVAEVLSPHTGSQKHFNVNQPEQIKAMKPEPIKAMKPEPIKAMKPETIKAMAPETIKAMAPAPIKAMKPEPINAMKIEGKEDVVQSSLRVKGSEGSTRRTVSASTAMVQVNYHGSSSNVDGLPRRIQTRSLLTTSVYHNESTGIWITTINMSQKSNVRKSNAAKYLKAFSFLTQREARESAYANAPAKMHPFTENPHCFACDQKFSVFRRASHCRNCGVCICNSCSVAWSKVALPDTYNIKNEKMVKVCKSCNILSKMFRQALLDANYENALTIYNTGNINLRCPFINAQTNEVMLPIHCAVEGGSIILLKWLVDVHYCPIKRIRTGNRNNKSQHSDELIATSKGRTVLEIAMAGQHVDILRYLINEKNLSILGIKDLQSSLAALEVVLKSIPALPEECSDGEDYDTDEITPMKKLEHERRYDISDNLPNYNISTMDDESTDSAGGSPVECDSDDEQSVVTTVEDAVSLFLVLFKNLLVIFLMSFLFINFTVYYLLRKFYRLRQYPMWASNLLFEMQCKYA